MMVHLKGGSIYMRVSSQEHKEESAGKKVLPKSRFFDLYFNKN